MDLSFDLFHIGFLRFTIVDLVDIGIVAFVLYRLYAVMRGTIAAQIFIGLLLIIAVSFVSRTLDMKLLSWVLRTAGNIWVIALIILFQPELRRILLLVGRNGLFTTFERYDVNKTIEELVVAADELALRRFGALIVVTRTSDISLSVDTGVPINAALSKEMLVSIFNPKSPLHDGAVVVSGDLIKSTRVILPLSPVTRASDLMLGTRHRAGLGISEQADVFVIIVSEESGNISYAREGRLYYDQSLDALRSALADALNLSGTGRGRLMTLLSRSSKRERPKKDSGDQQKRTRKSVKANSV